MTANPYLDAYWAQAEHERTAGHDRLGLGKPGQPDGWCGKRGGCKVCHGRTRMARTYSWAVPNAEAIAVIAEHGPIVEIGAGGGYWAKLLRAQGVDVVAYDPDPVTGYPHLGGARHGEDPDKRWSNVNWSDVRVGDHRSVEHHPSRTLLLVWPSYDMSWTHEVVELYQGDTVIYVGEGPGGCTGTDRMHEVLGNGSGFGCWHYDDECDCTPPADPRFTVVREVEIPQWGGIHDRLTVHKRIGVKQ